MSSNEINLRLLGHEHFDRVNRGVGLSGDSFGSRDYCAATFESPDEMADFVEAYREQIDPYLATYWNREYVFKDAWNNVHAVRCDKRSSELWWTDDSLVKLFLDRPNEYVVVPCSSLYESVEEFEESEVALKSLFDF